MRSPSPQNLHQKPAPDNSIAATELIAPAAEYDEPADTVTDSDIADPDTSRSRRKPSSQYGDDDAAAAETSLPGYR